MDTQSRDELAAMMRGEDPVQPLSRGSDDEELWGFQDPFLGAPFSDAAAAIHERAPAPTVILPPGLFSQAAQDNSVAGTNEQQQIEQQMQQQLVEQEQLDQQNREQVQLQ